MKKEIVDKSFHYTKEEMVKDLIDLIPLNNKDKVLDAGSGLNKVFYNNIPNFCERYECELDEGKDFLLEKNSFDWIIGNPPYHIAKDFLLHSASLSKKGIAFLINLTCLNSFLLPSRLKKMQSFGFYINKIHIVQDKRWFGRYFFVIFTKEPSSIISYQERSY